MSDYTANGDVHYVKRAPKAEFVIYFTLIFSLAVILHVPRWIFQAIRHFSLPRLSPMARAWCDAKAVTPMIFRG